MNVRTCVLLASLSLLPACGAHGLEEIEAEACEHLEEGPFEPLAASADAEGAPSADQTHVSYELTLLEQGDGSFGGFVAFESEEGGDHYVFSDAPLQLTFSGEDGAQLAVESRCESEPCSETCALVAERYQVDLPVGRTVIEVRGATSAEASLLVEAGEHDH
jgi:hypothetical protein